MLASKCRRTVRSSQFLSNRSTARAVHAMDKKQQRALPVTLRRYSTDGHDIQLPELDEALKALMEKRYARAETALKRVMEICKYMPPAFSTSIQNRVSDLLGYSLFEQKKFDLAHNLFNERLMGCTLDAKSTPSDVLRAIVLLHNASVTKLHSRLSEAVSFAQENIKRNGDNILWQTHNAALLVKAQCLLSDSPGQVATLDLLQSKTAELEQNLNSTDLLAVAVLGDAKLTKARIGLMNDVESAKSIFNEVVSLQKPILQDKEFLSNRKAHVAVQSLMEQTQADALLGIGEVALAKGQFLEAEESFTPAIDLTDKYFDYHGERVMHVLEKIAISQINQRKFFFAEGLYRRLLSFYEKQSSNTPVTTTQVSCMNDFIKMLKIQKRDSEAKAIENMISQLPTPIPPPVFDLSAQILLLHEDIPKPQPESY